MSISILIIILIGLVFLSGYFSASETALFSLPSTKIKAYQKNMDSRKRLIANLVLHPRDLLVTIFMLNTLVNILIQNVSSSLFGIYGGWASKIGLPLILTLLFGEIIPKYIGLQNNLGLSYYVAPTIKFIQDILKPIRQATISITAPVSRFLFFYLRKEENISDEELKHVLKKSQEIGVLHADEAELVWGYLNLQDSQVKELMRPREDILFYEVDEPLTKLTYLFVDQECSRIPVCNKTIENTIGIITAQNYFLNRHELSSGKQLTKFLSKPFFIPETTPGKTLLRKFEETGDVIALVVDEYGSISGLITHEDLVEVVVGEITDLRDPKNLYIKPRENEIIASGRLELSEFNDVFKTDLISAKNMVTIGGWLIEQIGDIPKSGDKYVIQNLIFQVLSADPKRIHKLFIRKLTKKTSNKQNQE